MDLNRILIKTAKGREEIEKRTYKLSPQLRRLLILVDGKNAVENLVDSMEMMLDVEKALENLNRDGFIGDLGSEGQPVEPSLDLHAIKRGIADFIFKDYGKDAGDLIMQLGACESADQVAGHMKTVNIYYKNHGNEVRGEEVIKAAAKLLSK